MNDNKNHTAAQPLDLAKQSFDERFSIDSHFGWKPLDYWRAGFDAALIARARAAHEKGKAYSLNQAEGEVKGATGTTGARELLPEDLLDELNDAVIEAFNRAFAIKDWSARDHWRDVLNRFEDWRAQGRDAPASAQPDRGAAQGGLAKVGYFIREGGAWVATSSDDPRATTLYRKTDTENSASPASQPVAPSDAEDAMRYRWVRVPSNHFWLMSNARWNTPEQFDKAIDAAMAAAPSSEKGGAA